MIGFDAWGAGAAGCVATGAVAVDKRMSFGGWAGRPQPPENADGRTPTLAGCDLQRLQYYTSAFLRQLQDL
ncbi:hypothetical protein [Pseudolysinimonas kribbensis]|nr:hypothetical protein [Pseudolysinimonas kribbensis]